MVNKILKQIINKIPKKKEEAVGSNNFSLFKNNNIQTQQEKLKENKNTNTNQSSLFSNIVGNAQKGTGLLGAPKQEEKKPTYNMNTTQNKTRTKYKIKLKHNLNTYKAKKSQNTLFGNNINPFSYPEIVHTSR